MSYQALGPGRLYYGNPETAAGADMINLGDHENITFSPGIRTAFTSSANTSGSPIPESLRSLSPNPTLVSELYDQDLEQLEALILGGVITESGVDPDVVRAFGFGGATKMITPKTLVFIPQPELADGSAAEHGIWLPSAFLENLGDLASYGRLTDAENNNPFTANFRAARALDSLGIAEEEGKYAFIGDPAAYGLTWSLPA